MNISLLAAQTGGALDWLFSSVLDYQIAAGSFFACTGASLVLGALLAVVYSRLGRCTKTFALALALLPFAVQLVIMMVSGSIGLAFAVAGAFSLVRFRSAAGTAREIVGVFIAMIIGLVCGRGYIGIAAIFAVITLLMMVLYRFVRLGDSRRVEKLLKITIPESLDYSGLFDDLFALYTSSAELMQVKTAQMGALYKLQYRIVLKDPTDEKRFIDALRCRNGNLDISCGRIVDNGQEL